MYIVSGNSHSCVIRNKGKFSCFMSTMVICFLSLFELLIILPKLVELNVLLTEICLYVCFSPSVTEQDYIHTTVMVLLDTINARNGSSDLLKS